MILRCRRVAATAALVLLVAGGGCGLIGEPDIETTTAAATVADLIDGVAADLDSSDYVDLDECPLDPGGTLLARAITDLADNDDVARAQSGELISQVNDADSRLPAIIACDRFEPPSSIGLVVTEAPDDLVRYSEIFAEGGDGGSGLTVEQLGSSGHRGGSLYRLCATPPADDEDAEADSDSDDYGYCEVDWLDENLMITLYLAGPSSPDADLDVLEAGLIGILDDLLANLGGTEA